MGRKLGFFLCPVGVAYKYLHFLLPILVSLFSLKWRETEVTDLQTKHLVTICAHVFCGLEINWRSKIDYNLDFISRKPHHTVACVLFVSILIQSETNPSLRGREKPVINFLSTSMLKAILLYKRFHIHSAYSKQNRRSIMTSSHIFLTASPWIISRG